MHERNPRRPEPDIAQLRSAFADLVARGLPHSEEALVEIGSGDETRPLRWLLGRLWNDRERMPDELCRSLRVLPRSSFAVGARRVRELIG